MNLKLILTLVSTWLIYNSFGAGAPQQMQVTTFKLESIDTAVLKNVNSKNQLVLPDNASLKTVVSKISTEETLKDRKKMAKKREKLQRKIKKRKEKKGKIEKRWLLTTFLVVLGLAALLAFLTTFISSTPFWLLWLIYFGGIWLYASFSEPNVSL